jgi:hypothetical protein
MYIGVFFHFLSYVSVSYVCVLMPHEKPGYVSQFVSNYRLNDRGSIFGRGKGFFL